MEDLLRLLFRCMAWDRPDALSDVAREGIACDGRLSSRDGRLDVFKRLGQSHETAWQIQPRRQQPDF